MAFAGPFALTRRRPALALLFCLVSLLSPFSVRHCFAQFCAFVLGWAFRRLRRESALSRGTRVFALMENHVFACRKFLLFSLRCALLGVSRIEIFVGIFALGCKNSRGQILQFSGSKNSSGLWAVARLQPTSYQPANRSAHEGCPSLAR